MGHLIRHVLPEPQPRVVHADLHQEVLDPGQEVSKCLLSHGAGSHRVPNLDLLGGLAPHLVVGGVQVHDGVRHPGELGVVLLRRVAEVLHLGHCELPDPRGDLVTVQVANVKLHGALLRSDHRVGVVTHAVLLGLAGLHHDGNTKELLT